MSSPSPESHLAGETAEYLPEVLLVVHSPAKEDAMVTYISGVYAKDGDVAAVEGLYRQLQDRLLQTEGFVRQTVYRALPNYAPPATGGHSEAAPPPGIHVINIEEWESTAVRTNFRRTPEFASWQRELVSHLNPLHSHDYYERVITTG